MKFKRTSWLMPLALIAWAAMAPGVTWGQPSTAPAERRGPGDRQGPPRDGRMFLERIVELMDEFELSEDQMAEARRIVDEARQDVRAMMRELRETEPAERAARLREKLDEVREQLDTILSEEQRELLRQRIEEMRPRRGPGRGAGPATAPAGAEGRLAALAQRFRQAVEHLELSEDQKRQALEVVDELRDKLRAAREQVQDDMDALRDKVREHVNDARLELQQILTPEQQQKLRELLEARPGPGPGAGAGRRPDRTNRPPSDQMDQPRAPDEPDNGDKPDDGPRAMAPPPDNLRPGQAAAEFSLEKLDGRPVQLSSFKGRILVLLFGNYSSPSFRERADEYEQLRRHFGNRADFLIIYTRETHPVNGWEVERNKRARIRVEQPKSIEERKALARQAKQALRITMPIALDTMDDKTAEDYAAANTCAVVIGRDGTIAAYRTHGDPHALRRMIEEAIAGKPAS